MKFYNRVKFSTSTSGTGTITVGSASSGFRTPAQAGIPDGTVVAYLIEDGTAWEEGYGTYTASGTTFSRNVRQSSNSDALISLSGSGVIVRVAMLAEEATGWQRAFSESGASFANFTSGGGTWTSDGTQITQTDTGATYRTAYLTARQQTGMGYILEADVKMLSAGAGATRIVGLVVGYSGANTSPGAAACLRFESSTRKAEVDRAFTTVLATVSGVSFADDAFYKLRLVASGGFASLYLDGVHIASGGGNPTGAEASYVGLLSFACGAHFKNIKGANLMLPVNMP